MANCGVEIAFAPKELKVAQDLSERLGYWTYAGRSSSRPTLLSKGNRSTTQSDQRRALMMPQELIQMSARKLIVLKAGVPPVRGDKLAYWRDRAFAKRVLPPPSIPAHAGVGASPVRLASFPATLAPAKDDLTMDLVLPMLEAEGLEPPPAHGASDEEVEAWVERFIDTSVRLQHEEADHAR